MRFIELMEVVVVCGLMTMAPLDALITITGAIPVAVEYRLIYELVGKSGFNSQRDCMDEAYMLEVKELTAVMELQKISVWTVGLTIWSIL